MQLLLEYPVNIEERDEQNRTPLHHAVTYNMPEMVQLLLENKAEIEARDINDQTPLHHAAWFQSVEAAVTET